MPFFEIKKKPVSGTQDKAQELKARSIVKHYLQWQRRWAGWMQDKTEYLSRKGKVAALLLFCLLAGGYSIYHATASLTGKQSFSLSVTSIEKPQYIQQLGEEGITAAPT